MRYRVKCLFVLTIFALASEPAGAGSGADSIVMRRGPGAGFEVLATFPRRTKAHVISCRAGWCAVRLGPYAGFVHASELARGGGAIP
jgi:SH3-like domain-containing protein